MTPSLGHLVYSCLSANGTNLIYWGVSQQGCSTWGTMVQHESLTPTLLSHLHTHLHTSWPTLSTAPFSQYVARQDTKQE